MIGQRFSATVWRVEYRYRKLDEKDRWVQGASIIGTADPTGSDLHDVARLIVLGAAAKPEHQFTVLAVQYANEVQGLAQLVQDGPCAADAVLTRHALGAIAREHAAQVTALTAELGVATAEIARLNALLRQSSSPGAVPAAQAGAEWSAKNTDTASGD